MPHTIAIDARKIRDVFPDVQLLQMLRFHTNGNGAEGQQFWFDNFRIVRGGVAVSGSGEGGQRYRRIKPDRRGQ